MDLPPCPNFAKKRGCSRSALLIRAETPDYWTFECATCELTWVVSKPNAVAGAALRKAQEDVRKRTEARRKREARPLWFT